jgi:hypothetical protein
MHLLTKAGVGLVVLLTAIAFTPRAKADPITIQTGGFALHNLGNNGTGLSDLDTLIGGASSNSHDVSIPGKFVAAINPLTFITGFTGVNSGGTYSFSFSQALTINGQTQILNLLGSIDIGSTVDTIHILSSAPLVFDFNTYSLAVNVLPTDIVGPGHDGGVFCSVLKAEFTVMAKDCSPVAEPATLTLLGLGMAGIAAKIRKRRRT